MCSERSKRLSVPSKESSAMSSRLSVLDPGAWPDHTRLLQETQDRVAALGGGKVVLGPGLHRSGTIHLRSGVQVRLEAGAVWKASDRIEDFEPLQSPVPSRSATSMSSMAGPAAKPTSTRRPAGRQSFAPARSCIRPTGRASTDCPPANCCCAMPRTSACTIFALKRKPAIPGRSISRNTPTA
jgi:hypothetical protein